MPPIPLSQISSNLTFFVIVHLVGEQMRVDEDLDAGRFSGSDRMKILLLELIVERNREKFLELFDVTTRLQRILFKSNVLISRTCRSIFLNIGLRGLYF